MNAHSRRAELERHLLEKATDIRRNNEGCFDNDILEDYLIAWQELKRYYEEHDEACLDIEVIREYLRWLNALASAWHNTALGSHCREQAREAVYQLEASLADIIKAVEMRRYPHGR